MDFLETMMDVFLEGLGLNDDDGDGWFSMDDDDD